MLTRTKRRISAGSKKLPAGGQPHFSLIQLAHRVKRKSPRWKSSFERLSRRVGNKKATCAIARRLLLVIYAMLRDGKAYQLPAAAWLARPERLRKTNDQPEFDQTVSSDHLAPGTVWRRSFL
jgi:hypothetical protein